MLSIIVYPPYVFYYLIPTITLASEPGLLPTPHAERTLLLVRDARLQRDADLLLDLSLIHI